MSQEMNITIVGSGYVGLVAAACFAELGHKVICVDNDEAKIAGLCQGKVPIHEEMLPELLAKHTPSKLEFTTDLRVACKNADAIFVAVGTPQDPSGKADLSYIDAVAHEIARNVDGYKVIVEKSTVPVFTSDHIARVMARNGVHHSNFDVVSNPEFLREGTAVYDFLMPDRIVVGAETDRSISMLRRVYEPLTSGSYYRGRNSIFTRDPQIKKPQLLVTSTKSAELIKHASNAFLAMKISFINGVSNLCEAAGADIDEVATGIGLDDRIGGKFLRAGIGYGGSCFPKDVAAFRHAAEKLGVSFGLLEETQVMNDLQIDHFVSKVSDALWTLRSKRVGVLGLSFKGGTDDLRCSPAVSIVKQLLKEGCQVRAYDPAGMENAKTTLFSGSAMQFVGNPYAAAQDADALLILTDWKEFAELDLQRLRGCLSYPIVIDGRNLFAPARMAAEGFDYISMGRVPVLAATASVAPQEATGLTSVARGQAHVD
jgi:UDPglucose 6-dehydrogenase